jgi:hypothetical protein
MVGEMLKEKRTQNRLQVDVTIFYKTSNLQSVAIKKAMACDISKAGICFYSDTFHEKGTNLQVMLPRILNSPKTCTVVWHSKIYDDHYKIGAHFLQNIF